MTTFRAPQPDEPKGQLGSLAADAVHQTLRLGSRIADAIDRGAELRAWLGSPDSGLGSSLSAELIELALSNTGSSGPLALGNKLAFLIFSTQPGSAVAKLLAGVAARSYRRAGAALDPFLDEGDLLSSLRWKLWTLQPDYFEQTRILKHPGLAAYVSVIARRILIDECRAMDNRARAGIDAATIEIAVDPRSAIDAVLDDLDLLTRLSGELPVWQAPLVQVLAGELDRDEALVAINQNRQSSGLAAWSPDALRTAVHRARARLRELIIEAPAAR